MGADAAFDAWLYSMMIDNNLDHRTNPDFVAGPEQLRFMVALEEDQFYFPCSEKIFSMLLEEECPRDLDQEYGRAWRIITHMIRDIAVDRTERRYLLWLCRYRFRSLTAQHTHIPARLVKRLTQTVLSQSGVMDPSLKKRREKNQRSREMLHLPDILYALSRVPDQLSFSDIETVRSEMNHLELSRLMFLSAMACNWLETPPSPLVLEEEFARAVRTAEALHPLFGAGQTSKTVLFLCDARHGIVFDVAFLKCLARMGHKILLALKENFYYNSATIYDAEQDPALSSALEKCHILRDAAISKNDLLRLLREHRMVVISDGTRERLNLYRTSVTFARAWKEADLIISKGWRNANILLETSQEFTRDILCYWITEDGEYHVQLRPHARSVRKFSEACLVSCANAIIEDMRQAHAQGKSVMFYSCIIGSIPGQTATATSVARTFVQHLRRRLPDTFIVNPTEHFEEGLDGDDLMFMWERVQRSGYIDIWRFQTMEDVESSFSLMERNIPPIWVGKDATFSTGCTKEMRIALDMQKKNPEMQIVGPAPEKFFRRKDYGVGKYFDAQIEH